MDWLFDLLRNPFLLTSVAAWLTSQTLKIFTHAIAYREWDVKRFFGDGGMPSSHSAFVMAIAMSVGVLYGAKSPLFAVAAGFALVVMYDAFNVRRAAGEHAKHINQMWEELREELQSVPAMEILRESLGHTPLQVVVGALLGGGVGCLALLFK